MKIERIQSTRPGSVGIPSLEHHGRIPEVSQLSPPSLEPNGKAPANEQEEAEDSLCERPEVSVVLDQAPSAEAFGAEKTLERWLERIRHAHHLDLRL